MESRGPPFRSVFFLPILLFSYFLYLPGEVIEAGSDPLAIYEVTPRTY